MKKPLTIEQKRVINAKEPVVAVKAGHGTGKTRTLAAFVAKKLRDADFRKIIVVTLTKTAAGEMKAELAKNAISNISGRLTVGTFHSFALRELQKNHGEIGFRSRIEVDQGVNERLLAKMVRTISLECTDDPKKIVEILGKTNILHLRSGKNVRVLCREMSVKVGVFSRKMSNHDIEIISRTIRRLKRAKRARNLMDFDDIVYYFWRRIKHSKTCHAIARDSLMVVDEFQDTTDIQWKAIKLLVGGGMNLMAAGDPFQTIYRFAGGSFDRFQTLEELPGCKTYPLTKNHRTTKEIVALSNALLPQCGFYDGQGLWSDNHGPKPEVIVSDYKDVLVNGIIEKIVTHMEEDNIPFKKMAVLFRFDSDAKILQQALIREHIPHVFLSKKAKKLSHLGRFVFGCLKIAQGQGRKTDWEHVLPCLKGIGGKYLSEIVATLERRGYDMKGLGLIRGWRYEGELQRLRELLQAVKASEGYPSKAVSSVIAFYRGLKKRRIGDLSSDNPTIPTIEEIARKSRDLQVLIANLNDPSFGTYYAPGSVKHGYLTLANIHRIKGGEFKVVFILGTYNRKRPSGHRTADFYSNNFERHGTFDDKDTIADEILIMNTAITRSRKYLYLMFPMTVEEWRKATHKSNPSIFIRRCPERLYDPREVRRPEDDPLQL